MRTFLIAATFALLLTACATTRNTNSLDRELGNPGTAVSTYDATAPESYDANGNYLSPDAYDDPFGVEHYIETHRYGT